MRARVDKLGDTDNAERWMVSYADFITLLFGFFVVMYAISSVNNEKYRVLSDTLAQAFEAQRKSPDPIQVGEPDLAASPHVVDVPDVDGWVDPEVGNTELAEQDEAEQDTPPGFINREGVTVRSDSDWTEISVAADVLFDAGSATLNSGATSALAPVVAELMGHDQAVTIEGYTDNVPSVGARYPSNWELSAARASAVARFFTASGIRPTRLAAIGYGENYPLETNATPEGRAANRRVAIVIARRQGLARNRNAAQAVLLPNRTEQQVELTRKRTAEGGLLFTNEPETDTDQVDEQGE